MEMLRNEGREKTAVEMQRALNNAWRRSTVSSTTKSVGGQTEILKLTKVCVYHPHPVVCVGLSALLEQAGVRQFTVKDSTAELLDSDEEDILLLDIKSIHELDDCLFRCLEQCCAQRTIVLATREQLIRFGGRVPEKIGSIISPRGALGNFVQAILAVNSRRIHVDENLIATWDRMLSDPNTELTNRQLEVLQLVAKGKTSVQIAGLLGVRPKTVENHRAAIKNRMGVVSAAEMVNEAHKRGIC